jgi:hypothetical protein
VNLGSVRSRAVIFFVFALILTISPLAHSEPGLFEPYNPANLSSQSGTSYLDIMVGLRKYFNSFTSWQLPANDGPQDPLSRLEYPWDQTFLAIGASAAYYGLEAKMEWSGTLGVLSDLKAQDSDWEDPGNPNQKTTFSEAEAKPHCWIIDFSFNTQIPGLSFLSGVAGYRLSQFKFTNTDGYQYGIYNEETHRYESYSLALPGPFIEFSQYYKQLYFGCILKSSLDSGEISGAFRFPPVLLRLQADASYVTGDSHDQHLLRYAFGIIRSSGVGWHVNLIAGLKTGRFRFDLEGDIRGIHTRGEIHNSQGDENVAGLIHNFYIDGARAWSEQKYFGVNGTISF